MIHGLAGLIILIILTGITIIPILTGAIMATIMAATTGVITAEYTEGTRLLTITQVREGQLPLRSAAGVLLSVVLLSL